MAIQKYRLCRGDDIIHLESSSGLIVRPDGTTVESALTTLRTDVNGKAASSHSHSNYVPTTRTVNGKALSSNISLAAADVSAVPTTRTVNGKALSANISLTASDVGAAATSHTHSNYVPTTRTIAGKALSADITADDLKTALGVTSGSPTITAPTYPSSVPAVGSTMSWAGKTWRVVHKLTGVAILALEYREKNVVWSSADSNYIQEYIGSRIYDECMTFANTLKLFAADYIIPFGGLPCFIPSYNQATGDFSYWATQANRIFKNSSGTAYTFWTSTSYYYGINAGGGRAWFVDTDGSLYSNGTPSNSCGFRPCVAIRL